MAKAYILGADASAGSEFKLPTGGNLLKAILSDENYDWAYPSDREQLQKFVGFFSRDGNLPDVEECLTFLDCSLSDMGRQIANSHEDWFSFHDCGWGGGFPPKGNARNMLTSPSELELVRRILIRQLGVVLLKGHVCERHALLLNDLEDLDQIITLNYDLIAEETLGVIGCERKNGVIVDVPGGKTRKRKKADRETETGHLKRLEQLLEEQSLHSFNSPTTGHPARDFVFGSIYHLHGALNWLSCPDPLCSNHSRVRYEHSVHEYRMMGGLMCAVCGSMMEPVIVPPTMLKDYVRFPKIRLMWNLASMALGGCEQLIVIGCSFRPDDFYLRNLLRTSIREDRLKSVSIVGLGSEADLAAERFQSSISFRFDASKLTVFRGGFDEYLSKNVKRGNRK